MVFLCNKKINQHKVAVKVIAKDSLMKSKKLMNDLENEIRVHWALTECEGALQLTDIFEEIDAVCLVLEY